MILQGNCTKCGELIKLDIGDKTVPEVVEILKSQRDGFSCPGHHVELGPAYPHYWKVDEWTLVDGAAMTEEAFLAELKSKYKEVRDTAGMQGLITGFAYGSPMTNDGHAWDFCSSPKGKRWYYRS
jgi:hypothetical protein